MKQRLFKLIILAGLICCTLAAALWADDIADRRSCENCGMDRKMYGYSRMLIQFADGTEIGTCSLNCAVVELEKAKSRPVKALLVADRDSRTMIDAKTAHWVMGGDKTGVMARRAKWAFATEGAAKAFVKTHGGAEATWDTILRAAREDATE